MFWTTWMMEPLAVLLYFRTCNPHSFIVHIHYIILWSPLAWCCFALWSPSMHMIYTFAERRDLIIEYNLLSRLFVQQARELFASSREPQDGSVWFLLIPFLTHAGRSNSTQKQVYCANLCLAQSKMNLVHFLFSGFFIM